MIIQRKLNSNNFLLIKPKKKSKILVEKKQLQTKNKLTQVFEIYVKQRNVPKEDVKAFINYQLEESEFKKKSFKQIQEKVKNLGKK